GEGARSVAHARDAGGRAALAVHRRWAARAAHHRLPARGRARGPHLSLVPEPRRRRDAAPHLPRLARRRRAGHRRAARRRADPLRLPGRGARGEQGMTIIDLSFPIKPHFRWKALSDRVATHAAGDPLQSTVMTISCHAYTHVD